MLVIRHQTSVSVEYKHDYHSKHHYAFIPNALPDNSNHLKQTKTHAKLYSMINWNHLKASFVTLYGNEINLPTNSVFAVIFYRN